ncbi:hypothetical protein AZL_a04310 (plasmid) [Azospirillum sp. B510]|uniref:hypothetical protein n=1 Tax=Azospirillum sp. (strain B510) TaxID=137722 RepID=UPI0001C4BBD3|nr:hypothetical protein [Azospirillum sp. B510]BAI73962.1 hypothetical protein AZL_a04310 [Azospirillum sp. B510]
MSAPTCCLARIPANGKFWLKNARVDGGLRDIRIENGRIRALLPAGESPCCAPGLDLDGGDVRRMDGDGPVVAGESADLWVTLCGGRTVRMLGGTLEAGVRRDVKVIDGSFS